MITHPLIYCDWLEEQGKNVTLLREDLDNYSQNRNFFDDGNDDGYGCGDGGGNGNGIGFGQYSYGGNTGDGVGDGCLFAAFNRYGSNNDKAQLYGALGDGFGL